jgi:hypothetical protein
MKFKLFRLTVISLLLASLIGMGQPVFAAGTPPTVSTEPATFINQTTAQLNANLSAMGTAPYGTGIYFEYGTSSGTYANEVFSSKRYTVGSANRVITNLTPGTTYYFRAKAVGDGFSYGSERSFTTPTAVAPTIATNTATYINQTTAQLNAYVNSIGTNGTGIYFQWGTTSGDLPNEVFASATSIPASANRVITNLTPGTTYYFRAKAVGEGVSYGIERSFTTLTSIAPTVSTEQASYINQTTAQLNANVSACGSCVSWTGIYFEWGTTSGSYTNEVFASKRSTAGSGNRVIINLTPGTTY